MGYFGSTRKNTGELLHTDLVLNAVFSFFTDVTRATMKITQKPLMDILCVFIHPGSNDVL
jgi:hypothetical protein